MKKILMMIFCLILLMGSASADPMAVPGEKMGFNLLSMLHVSGENTVISPESLALALGMAAEGAQGDTLDEMLQLLGADDTSALPAVPEGLESANAVFTVEGLELKPEYVEQLREYYGAEWFKIGADVLRQVNDWVREHTNGLIEQLLSEEPASGTGLILLNAVAMDAKWAFPFSPEITMEAPFHAPDGDVAVMMMEQKEYFDYAEKDGIQIVRLPYQEGGLEMWIALPPEGGMFRLLEILANEGMFYLKSDAERREVILSLPKMDISDDQTLTEALKLLGMERAFSLDADFSGISDTPLYVDEILQKVRVQVTEDGTRAAAATALIMKWMGVLPAEEPVEMEVNRPFIFVISDSESGSVCFAGAVENPAK